ATLYQPRRSPRPTLFPYTTLFRSYPPPPPGHRAFGQNAHALASGRRALSGNRPAEGTRESGAELRSDVEAELHHVPVGHDVVLALHADLAGGLGRGHRTGFHQVVVGDDLGLDEAALEVGVDDARRLRSRPALADRPGPRLLRARGQEGLQTEGVETGPGQRVQPRLRLA